MPFPLSLFFGARKNCENKQPDGGEFCFYFLAEWIGKNKLLINEVLVMNPFVNHNWWNHCFCCFRRWRFNCKACANGLGELRKCAVINANVFSNENS